MVRGLTVAINNSTSEKKPTISFTDVKKRGENISLIIDGVSLAYYILEAKDKEHSWEFANGGDYEKYAEKMTTFLKTFIPFKAKITIAFPLPEGTPPASEQAVARWTAKTEEKIRRISRVRQLLDKSGSTSRLLLDVLPPFIVQEVAEVAKKAKIDVIYTRNPITKFIANFIVSGNADAVVALNSDYIIFPGVQYIPIDSFFTNEQDIRMCDCLTSDLVCELIGLVDPAKLTPLSVLLGNAFTEPFLQKYNMATALHIKLNPKYPAALAEGVVEYLNSEKYESLTTSSPIKEIAESDPLFAAAIQESIDFFDLGIKMEPEGESDIRKLVDSNKLPSWSVAVSEGGDFWYEPIVDDYMHDCKTSQATLQIRKILYSILGRKSVIEHIPENETLTTNEIVSEEGIPDLLTIVKMKATKLKMTFYNIAHANFPVPPQVDKDPLAKLEEPFFTIGLVLRNMVAQCFTENCPAHTKIPSEAPQSLKDAKVLSAPPIDLHELRALAGMVVLLNSMKMADFQAPEFKPKLRRIKVIALYQSILQHFIWLQQFFNQKSDLLKPHRFFDGQLFAALYDANGDIKSDLFAPYFSSFEELPIRDSKILTPFMEAILFPFPADLFSFFETMPRSIYAANPDDVKSHLPVLVKAVSRFAQLLGDDEEEDAPPPPPPVIIAPPPPAPVKPIKEKKETINEDEEMEFLLAAASKKDPSKAPAPAVASAPKKKPTTVHKRKVDTATESKQVFNKESKNEVKRQLKQKGFEW